MRLSLTLPRCHLRANEQFCIRLVSSSHPQNSDTFFNTWKAMTPLKGPPVTIGFPQGVSHPALASHRPATLSQVREVTATSQHHSHWQRPHHGRPCQDLSPQVAHPQLPPLPALPEQVDPDAWLRAVDGRACVRRVGSDGCLTIDTHRREVG